MNGDLSKRSSEQGPQGGWLKLLDMLRIVSPTPNVFPLAEIAQSKEGLPGYGNDTVPATDASELCNRTFRRFQVLENLETGDDVGAVRGERQHSGVRSDAGKSRKLLEGPRELVVPIFDTYQRAGVHPHCFQRQPLAYADIDPDAIG